MNPKMPFEMDKVVRLVYMLSDIGLNCVLSGLANFIILRALIGLYNIAGAYNGDYSFIVTYAYWMEIGFIYFAAVVWLIRIAIEERLH
jgi:hypothetical protein